MNVTDHEEDSRSEREEADEGHEHECPWRQAKIHVATKAEGINGVAAEQFLASAAEQHAEPGDHSGEHAADEEPGDQDQDGAEDIRARAPATNA